ncbi:MAG: hypothetical protein ACI362_04400, partial [Coriobacteriales bacterium]
SAYGGSPCENMHVSHATACAVSAYPIEFSPLSLLLVSLIVITLVLLEQVVAEFWMVLHPYYHLRRFPGIHWKAAQ